MNFECREEEVARIEMERMVVVAGQEEDETSLLVKDTDGNIIKGVPVCSKLQCKDMSSKLWSWKINLDIKVRVVRPHRMEVVSHPYPQSKQVKTPLKFLLQVDHYS